MGHADLLDFQNAPTLYQCESAWRWDPPVLADYDFWCVLGGKGFLRVNDFEGIVRAGSAFLFKPGDRVIAGHDPRYPLRVIAFHFLPGPNCPLDVAALPPYREVGDLSALAFHAREATRGTGQTGAGLSLRETLASLALLNLLEISAQTSNSRNDQLERAAEWMRSAPGEVESIAAVAKRFGMASAHFSRSFKAHLGESPVVYWNHFRLERAATLLLETHLSLEEIADILGYSSVYHLSRRFRAVRGSPPGRWRKAHRPE